MTTAFAAVLAPWWRLLPDGCLTLRYKTDELEMRPLLRTLELTLPPPRTERATAWPKTLEVVEILLLASWVRPLAFREMVQRECWNGLAPFKDMIDQEVIVPLRLYVRTGTNTNIAWEVEALTTLLAPTGQRSDAFVSTYSTLMQLASESRIALENVEIPADFHLDDRNKQFTLEALTLFARHQRRQRHATTTHRVSFAVGSVSLEWGASIDSTELYDAGVASVQQHILVNQGFSSDPLATSVSAERKALWRWMTTMTRLRGNGSVLSVNEGSCSDDQMLPRTRRVVCPLLQKEEFATLCAHLMFSNHLEELDVRLTSSLEGSRSNLTTLKKAHLADKGKRANRLAVEDSETITKLAELMIRHGQHQASKPLVRLEHG
ncbi:hypothetical protein Poli38472_013723 [Pythium oligandrum]|uniref:Uncharacterized protein n=1 Tax=Pythium oligandrum TaxID=41045 RepID=A0A8K1FF50_PYTOL|nr:hypothetical protein Poli38472_013723 [Pythium oligandrum]|eukprot:TMW61260.1 hypothetical protein Poli38472_013723 [Pythium oligandrum]